MYGFVDKWPSIGSTTGGRLQSSSGTIACLFAHKRFRGRATEVINVGGTKVSPTEVEHSILQLDFVRDVMVFGEPHSLLGQIVSARVVLETAQLTRGEAIKRIWQHCRRNLGPQMAPVKIEITTDTMVNERQKRLRSLRNV
jgi:acyl-coenzyme A synthetase/AMP-(fatty) acid ligase